MYCSTSIDIEPITIMLANLFLCRWGGSWGGWVQAWHPSAGAPPRGRGGRSSHQLCQWAQALRLQACSHQVREAVVHSIPERSSHQLCQWAQALRLQTCSHQVREAVVHSIPEGEVIPPALSMSSSSQTSSLFSPGKRGYSAWYSRGSVGHPTSFVNELKLSYLKLVLTRKERL